MEFCFSYEMIYKKKKSVHAPNFFFICQSNYLVVMYCTILMM